MPRSSIKTERQIDHFQGMGKLFRNGELLGRVTYNIEEWQTFIKGPDYELPDRKRYAIYAANLEEHPLYVKSGEKLLLELNDGTKWIITVSKFNAASGDFHAIKSSEVSQ